MWLSTCMVLVVTVRLWYMCRLVCVCCLTQPIFQETPTCAWNDLSLKLHFKPASRCSPGGNHAFHLPARGT